MKTVRLTMAQALVRYLSAQKIEVDGQQADLFAGVFAIFGHGNVAGLGHALEENRSLPTFRGHNEQSMAHAAVAFANATSSAQLAALHPESGGTYVYGRRRLGPAWGHLAGWGFVVGKTASCAAMALTVGAYLWPAQERLAAVLAVAYRRRRRIA